MNHTLGHWQSTTTGGYFRAYRCSACGPLGTSGAHQRGCPFLGDPNAGREGFFQRLVEPRTMTVSQELLVQMQPPEPE